MPITVPADGAVISASVFGKPVADAVNAVMLSQYVAGVPNLNIPINVQTTVCSLTIPAASLPAGRHAIIGYGIHITQATAAVMDILFHIGATTIDHQAPASAAGIIVGGSFWLLGDGTQKVCDIAILAWGGQPAKVNFSQINALILPA